MLPELDETELRLATEQMFRKGGVANVLDCVMSMKKVEGIILSKLRELVDDEHRDFLGQ